MFGNLRGETIPGDRWRLPRARAKAELPRPRYATAFSGSEKPWPWAFLPHEHAVEDITSNPAEFNLSTVINKGAVLPSEVLVFFVNFLTKVLLDEY